MKLDKKQERNFTNIFVTTKSEAATREKQREGSKIKKKDQRTSHKHYTLHHNSTTKNKSDLSSFTHHKRQKIHPKASSHINLKFLTICSP